MEQRTEEKKRADGAALTLTLSTRSCLNRRCCPALPYFRVIRKGSAVSTNPFKSRYTSNGVDFATKARRSIDRSSDVQEKKKT